MSGNECSPQYDLRGSPTAQFGRVRPERLVVGAAVVVAGEAEPARRPEDEERGRKRHRGRPPARLRPEPGVRRRHRRAAASRGARGSCRTRSGRPGTRPRSGRRRRTTGPGTPPGAASTRNHGERFPRSFAESAAIDCTESNRTRRRALNANHSYHFPSQPPAGAAARRARANCGSGADPVRTCDATRSPIAGPILKPCPDPPPAIHTLATPGWRSMMKCESVDVSYWQTSEPSSGAAASAGNRCVEKRARPPRCRPGVASRVPSVGSNAGARRVVRDLEAAIRVPGNAVDHRSPKSTHTGIDGSTNRVSPGGVPK